jgi:hypothetical protein
MSPPRADDSRFEDADEAVAEAQPTVASVDATAPKTSGAGSDDTAAAAASLEEELELELDECEEWSEEEDIIGALDWVDFREGTS